jgi:sRNA-binding regulator protein Hfq
LRKPPRPPFRPKDPTQQQARHNRPDRPRQPFFKPPDDIEELPDDAESSEPEESAHRETEYLRRLTDEHRPIRVRLKTGEEFRGHIEYYDRRFIRLTTQGGPNLFIYKQDIKYLAEEA